MDWSFRHKTRRLSLGILILLLLPYQAMSQVLVCDLISRETAIVEYIQSPRLRLGTLETEDTVLNFEILRFLEDSEQKSFYEKVEHPPQDQILYQK